MNIPASASALSVPKRDLVVTFVEDHPKAILLLWAARKRAQEIGGRWRVVFIETPSHKTSDHSRHEYRLRLLTRAKHMGAETEHLEAMSLGQGMEQLLAREAAQLARVVVGSIEADDILRHFRPVPWMRLVQMASRYAQVEVVPLTGQFHQPFRPWLLARLREIEPMHLFYAMIGVAVPAFLAWLLQSSLSPALFRINEQNIDNLFLISAAVIAGRYGLVPGAVTAIVGFITQNYYFMLPYHTLKLSSMTDLFSMLLFLSAALIISIFTSQMRDYAQKVTRRELRTEMLFTLYRLTSESYTRQQAIETLQQNLEQMLKADVAFFLPTALNQSVLEAVSPNPPVLSDNDQKALAACWADMKSTGAASPFNPGTSWRFEPMIAASSEVGVLGVRTRDSNQLDTWFGRLLSATADQTGAILSHIELERSMEATRLSEEREKLRAMLLSSVSHDLKTPLAGIIGALSAHQTLGSRMKPEKLNELIEGSLEEAQRLDSFITNILDMTRLETGNIKFKQEWYRLDALTEGITKRLQHRFKRRDLVLGLPEVEVEAFMDPVMTGQVLQNLLDNACKYTAPGTRVEVMWKAEEGKGILCEVRDYGEGIPPENLERIFDKYARLLKKDSQTAGTGLGLAISKAIMESQGGWIKAANHPEGGAQFTFCLPQWRRAAPPEQEEGSSYAVG